VVPIIVAAWAAFTWFFSLPGADVKWEKNQKEFELSQKYVAEILDIAGDRLDYEKAEEKSKDFDFVTVVNQYASDWKIPTTDFTLNTGKESRRSGRQRIKPANISLKPISISTFTNFLSSMMDDWQKLQCEEISLTKQKTGKDHWKIDIKLIYYY
jgi:hypothetical protein